MARELSEEEEDAQQLRLGGEFQKSKCLLNAEVIDILQQRQQFMEDSGAEFTTTPVFEKSLTYATRFKKYNSREAATEVRKALTNRGLKQFEICAIGNLCPQTVAEAKAIQASLLDQNRKDHDGNPIPLDEDDIETLLNEITTTRRFS